MNPAPSPDHQTVWKHLQYLLYTQVELGGLGKVFNAPIDVQLGEFDIVQPDLVITSGIRQEAEPHHSTQAQYPAERNLESLGNRDALRRGVNSGVPGRLCEETEMLNLDRRDLLRATIALAIPPGIVPLLGGCQQAKNTNTIPSDVPLGTGDTNDESIERNSLTDENHLRVQYLEIVTPEVDAVCAQFSKVHGVTFGDRDPNLGGARTAKLMGGGMLGIRGPLRDDERPVVRPYILVEDIAASVTAASEAGAEIALPPMELPGHGTCAIVVQGGIDFGLWQL